MDRNGGRDEPLRDPVQYRKLTERDLPPSLLDDFDRYQETTHVWVRAVDGIAIKRDSFSEDWDGGEKQRVLRSLRNCIASGGAVIGAFVVDRLVGLVSVEPRPFGSQNQYLEVSHMHVSRPFRGRGIGKTLFERSCIAARRMGAQNLYIGAHPSVDTQEFYRSLGCTFAGEINPEIYQHEPRDLQLEYDLQRSYRTHGGGTE